jgi:SAM-dependent methyltransferase
MNILKHEKYLKKNVFFCHNKWPHFNLLFNDIKKLSKNKKFKKIISIERGGLYGSISLFKPFFKNKDFISIDCSSKKILNRGSYNKKFVVNKNIIKLPIDYHRNYKRLSLKNSSADLIIIPNLMHHIFDFSILFKQCKKALKKDGRIYIFEPLIREIHQAPNDYFRFSPFAMEVALKKAGFINIKKNYSGGPFTAALYCLDQASQYLPNKLRKKFIRNFFEKNYFNFLKLEKKYNKNFLRNHTSFPVSFSTFGQK